jgi:4-hydroxyproline epimerase
LLLSARTSVMLTLDVAYGGNFYAIVDVQDHFPGLEHFTADQLIGWSRELRKRINAQHSFVHPNDTTINGCSHILWAGAVLDKRSTARNAVFYGDKAIDRSPCGTGTSARMAQWAAKGKLRPGDEFIHESIIGSTFTGRIEKTITLGDRDAIIPSVEGWAKVYGYNTISINREDDPYACGFQVILRYRTGNIEYRTRNIECRRIEKEKNRRTRNKEQGTARRTIVASQSERL